MLKKILAAAALACLTMSPLTPASAATGSGFSRSAQAPIATPDARVQPVHWERRGHRRVWVPDHRPRHGRYYH